MNSEFTCPVCHGAGFLRDVRPNRVRIAGELVRVRGVHAVRICCPGCDGYGDCRIHLRESTNPDYGVSSATERGRILSGE